MDNMQSQDRAMHYSALRGKTQYRITQCIDKKPPCSHIS